MTEDGSKQAPVTSEEQTHKSPTQEKTVLNVVLAVFGFLAATLLLVSGFAWLCHGGGVPAVGLIFAGSYCLKGGVQHLYAVIVGSKTRYKEQPAGRIQISRPRGVSQGITLLYAALGIRILQTIVGLPRVMHAHAISIDERYASLIPFLVIISLATTGGTWFLIYMVGKGKNWARLTYCALVALLALAAIPTLSQLIQTFGYAPAVHFISNLLVILQLPIQIVALFFLFQRPSSDWFKRMKTDGKDAQHRRAS